MCKKFRLKGCLSGGEGFIQVFNISFGSHREDMRQNSISVWLEQGCCAVNLSRETSTIDILEKIQNASFKYTIYCSVLVIAGLLLVSWLLFVCKNVYNSHTISGVLYHNVGCTSVLYSISNCTVLKKNLIIKVVMCISFSSLNSFN